jgi:hypothetical protein
VKRKRQCGKGDRKSGIRIREYGLKNIPLTP